LKKILVIQTAFIGDAILITSVLEKLHTFFPQAELYLMVKKGTQTLFESHPFLKTVLVFDKSQSKLKHLWQLIRQVRQLQFDVVINAHRFASSGIITALSKAPSKIGFKKNPLSFFYTLKVPHNIGDGTHEIERNHQLIQALTDDKKALPKLYPSKGHFETINSYVHAPFICMAPSSVWFTKQLPLEKWISLCNKIPSDTIIYLLGAETDKSLCKQIQTASHHKKISVLCGQLRLLDSCALMSKAKMNYVNDSAPLHLASAMNAPVTAFFCSTVPAFGFTPLSENAKIVEVKTHLACKPCGLHGYKACPENHFSCGHLIDIDSIE
jgi:ADP-heptose:LPS heptosyltransferase